MVNLLQLAPDEKIAALLAVRDFDEHDEAHLLFATRLGRVKRTPLNAYSNIRATGLRAVVINEGDTLLSVHLTNNRSQVFMGTHLGMGIRFEEVDARPMGRVSAGVRGINLRDGDFVEEVAIVDPEKENDILTVTDLGYGKRTAVDEFRLQLRGGYGVKLIRLSEKTGVVAGVRHVQEDDEVLMVTERGMLIRMAAAEIRRIGRATLGVRLIRLDEDDRLVSVARAENAGDENDGTHEMQETAENQEGEHAGGEDA